MSQFVQVPPERVAKDSLQALLEEYATRDGTDYGEREASLAAKVEQLHRQLLEGAVVLLFDVDEEVLDLVTAEKADLLRSS